MKKTKGIIIGMVMAILTTTPVFAGTKESSTKVSGPWTGNWWKTRYSSAASVQKYGFNSVSIDEDQIKYYHRDRSHQVSIKRPGKSKAFSGVKSKGKTINYQIRHYGGPVTFTYYSYY